MEKQKLSELRKEVVNFYTDSSQQKTGTIKHCNRTWNCLQKFMEEQHLDSYYSQVGRDFLTDSLGNFEYSKLTKRQKMFVRHVSILNDFLEFGGIKCRRRELELIFEGETGRPFNDFFQREEQSKKGNTMVQYKKRLIFFYSFLKKEGCLLSSFNFSIALKYLLTLDNAKPANERDRYVMTLRVFFRFLCERKEVQECRLEKWMSFFALKHTRHSKVPSVYTSKEVERLIGIIDRTGSKGKRDYAMVLLAARYGLRSSDIVGMRFSDIHWEQNEIIVYQFKTGKKINLPISEEVGTAIIDYIRYARPKIENERDMPYVFLTINHPYRQLCNNALGAYVGDYMRSAGIDTTGRRHGAHTLRHSLASNLLKLNETLPVISEILGHKSTDSTMNYLRVDINQLRKCAIEVPYVPTSFYLNLYSR
jgi:site-specific recombinase XerD